MKTGDHIGSKGMRKIVEEVDNEGLIKLIGETVTLWCMNYIYTGKLVGVSADCVLLKDAYVVYETGELNTKEWKDAQKLPNDWYVRIQCVESFGILK